MTEGTLITLAKSVSEEWWRQEPGNSGTGEMGVEKGEFVSAEDLQGCGDICFVCFEGGFEGINCRKGRGGA